MHLNLLLALCAISGEFPASLLDRLYGSSYKHKLVTNLKKEGLLSTYYKDGLRSYRLTAKGRNFLQGTYPDRFSEAMIGSGQLKTDISRRRRLHALCEVYTSMYLAGIPFFKDMVGPIDDCAASMPAFYEARYIKTVKPDLLKIQNARFTGLLLAEAAAYLVYNTGDNLLRWDCKAEQRALGTLSSLLTHEWRPGMYGRDEYRGIVLGRNHQTALYLLSHPQRGSPRSYHMDGVFSHLHFVSMDNDGDLLLRILSHGEVYQRIRDSLQQGLDLSRTDSNIPNDGYDAGGFPVLLAFDFDLPKLHSFIGSLSFYGTKGRLICFPFQAPVIEQLAGAVCTIQVLDTGKVQKYFHI